MPFPWANSKRIWCFAYKNKSNYGWRHIVTKYLSGDGNFRLVHEMNGKKDPDDVSLTNGDAYFVQWANFEAYLDVASLQPEEVNVFMFRA